MAKLPLNLSYLKYFCDAAQEGSISAASRCNHVSQSAISQAISKLEESTGHKLLDHRPNRFKMTEKGKMLFENAKEIFHALQKTEDSLEESGFGNVEFACTHSFAMALVPHYFKKAQKLFPHMQINFRVAHPNFIIEWLKKETVDFGVISSVQNLNTPTYESVFSFEHEVIYQGEYRLYVSSECTDPESLGFLLTEECNETLMLKNCYAQRFGKELPVTMQISSWQAVATLAEAGIGIGFLPDYVALPRGNHLKRYLCEIAPIPYKLYAIFPKSRYCSNAAKQFIKLLQTEYTETI